MKMLAILTLSAVAGVCQPVERTLPFRELRTAAEFAEAATVIRSVGEIQELRVDGDLRSLTVRGDRRQTELAEWLLARLDRTSATAAPVPGERAYAMGDSNGTVIRVLYFQNAATAQARNEMATLIRSLLEIRGLFVSMAAGALVLRASPGHGDGAEWVFAALDGGIGNGEHRMAGGGDDVLRLVAVAGGATVEEFYRRATGVRTALQLRQLFTYSPNRVVAIRGTAAQTGRAAEMLLGTQKTP